MSDEGGEGWGEHLRVVVRDSEPQFQLRCPGCGVWADIDDDQLHGRVSVEHGPGSDDRGFSGVMEGEGCGYHAKRDWFAEALEHTGRQP